MPKVSHEDFEATKFLGGVVGAKDPFLKFIAMCSQDERELIAYLECLGILIDNENLLKMDLNEMTNIKTFMKKVMKPILQKIGEAKYKMGEISHLSMKIGSTRRSYKIKDGELPTV